MVGYDGLRPTIFHRLYGNIRLHSYILLFIVNVYISKCPKVLGNVLSVVHFIS